MADSFVNINGVSEPYNINAEKAVLGSILKNPACLIEVINSVKTEHFYLPLHKSIFEAMVSIDTQGNKIDPLIVLEELKKDNVLDDESGRKYLFDLASAVPTTRNVSEYCQMLVDYTYRRSLINTMQRIIESAQMASEDTETLIERAEQELYDIRRDNNSDTPQRAADIVMNSLYPKYQALQYDEKQPGADPEMVARKEQLKAMSTGFSHLDKILAGGFHKSDFIVIGARPAMGKTALALNLARNIAFSGKKVVFFSLEMSSEQLAQRLLSTEARIKNEKLRTGDFGADEWTKIGVASNALCETDLYFDDTANITVPEIKAKVRRMKDVDCVIIDYIGLMHAAGKRANDSRVNEVSEITRTMKMMAKDLNIPVVACAQLNRDAAKGNKAPGEGKKTNHRPQMTELRESGSIEQDADIIIMIHRENYYNNAGEDDIPEEKRVIEDAELIISKNRHGATGKVDVAWNNEFTRFSTLERIRDDQ